MNATILELSLAVPTAYPFHMKRICGLALIEDRFINPRPNYNPQDSAFCIIWARV